MDTTPLPPIQLNMFAEKIKNNPNVALGVILTLVVLLIVLYLYYHGINFGGKSKKKKSEDKDKDTVRLVEEANA